MPHERSHQEYCLFPFQVPAASKGCLHWVKYDGKPRWEKEAVFFGNEGQPFVARKMQGNYRRKFILFRCSNVGVSSRSVLKTPGRNYRCVTGTWRLLLFLSTSELKTHLHWCLTSFLPAPRTAIRLNPNTAERDKVSQQHIRAWLNWSQLKSWASLVHIEMGMHRVWQSCRTENRIGGEMKLPFQNKTVLHHAEQPKVSTLWFQAFLTWACFHQVFQHQNVRNTKILAIASHRTSVKLLANQTENAKTQQKKEAGASVFIWCRQSAPRNDLFFSTIVSKDPPFQLRLKHVGTLLAGTHFSCSLDTWVNPTGK